MSALKHSTLSLSGQIGLLITAVSEFERQQACDQQALARASALRVESLRQARLLREKAYKSEILDDVRNHPGSKTNEIANRLEHERSFIFRLLREIEADGQVIQVGTGKVLKWEATK